MAVVEPVVNTGGNMLVDLHLSETLKDSAHILYNGVLPPQRKVKEGHSYIGVIRHIINSIIKYIRM